VLIVLPAQPGDAARKMALDFLAPAAKNCPSQVDSLLSSANVNR
jgi:hypothetical protein